MNRFMTTIGFDVLDSDQTIAIGGRHGATLVFRSEERARYYASDDDWKTEILVGLAEGETEICVRGQARQLRAQSTGRVWVRNEVRPQTKERLEADVFTTLDRPPPMSPEMRAVHELMKRNEIDREIQRQEMKDLLDERDRNTAKQLQADTPKASRTKGGNAQAGNKLPAKRTGDKVPEVPGTGSEGHEGQTDPEHVSPAKDPDAGPGTE